MPFVKLDTRILDSTIWLNRDERDVFLTSLLMAEPFELVEPTEQISVRDLTKTGFVIPSGWYGFCPCAGIGLVRRALVDSEKGLDALERLGGEDPESRSHDHGGRRLVRIDGGYIVLNYMKYREKDHTAKERMRRMRDRNKGGVVTRNDDVVTRNVTPQLRNVTHADADADADAETYESQNKREISALAPVSIKPSTPPILEAMRGIDPKPLKETHYEPLEEAAGPSVDHRDVSRFDKLVESIAKAQPRGDEVMKGGLVASHMEQAIIRAANNEIMLEENACEMKGALTYLLKRAIFYREYTNKWPDSDKRFICPPVRFFDDNVYRQPETQWDRSGVERGTRPRRENAAEAVDRETSPLIERLREEAAGGAPSKAPGRGTRGDGGLKSAGGVLGAVGRPGPRRIS